MAGDIVLGGYCPEGYWRGDIVRRDIGGGILSGGILSGGILAGGYCPDGYCPVTSSNLRAPDVYSLMLLCLAEALTSHPHATETDFVQLALADSRLNDRQPRAPNSTLDFALTRYEHSS